MIDKLSPRTIAVVGLGAWGSALALHCAKLGHTVIGWHRGAEFAAHVASTRCIPCGVSAYPIPENFTVTSSLVTATEKVDLIVVALPSQACAEVLPQLPKNRILVSATKGLEKSSGLTPLLFASQKLGFSAESLCVVSGPSFASDLAASRPISVVMASVSESTAITAAHMLSGDSLRAYVSTDPLGVELGGILKNVIAIACGISDSLGFGPSARAALIARGLAEMTRLAVALGADIRTLSGLSGLGDLVMTATDDQSRNRQVGLRLGRGEKIADIIKNLGSTAEGVSTAPLVADVASKNGIETPITDLIVQLLNGQIEPMEVARSLMSRPLRREF